MIEIFQLSLSGQYLLRRPKVDVNVVAAYTLRIFWTEVFYLLLQKFRLIFLRGIETRTHIHTVRLFPQPHLKLLLGDHLSL